MLSITSWPGPRVGNHPRDADSIAPVRAQAFFSLTPRPFR